MSLSAKSQAIAVRKKIQHQSLAVGLQEWGFEFKGGQLWDVEDELVSPSEFFNSSKLHFYDIDAIERGLNNEAFEKLLEGKSSGARYLARRLRRGCQDSINSILSDWAALKELRHWLYQQESNHLRWMDLDSAGKLLYLGIRFAWQAERFCELYSEVCVTDRPWGSCYQPSHGKIKALALTPNYNRLPLWVKKILVSVPQWIETNEVNQGRNDRPEGGRIGNVWRLIDCAKAWKHAPYLPKGIAEKVGRMSVESRLLADWAWEKALSKIGVASGYTINDVRWRWDGEYSYQLFSRADLIQFFWLELKRLQPMPLTALIDERYSPNGGFSKDDHNCLRNLAEIRLNLPHGFLFEAWGRLKYASKNVYLDAIASHGSPVEVCRNLFGNGGDRTVSLFKNASKDAWRWASAVCDGNADAVQKVLALREIISFQPDAVEFLKSLPLQSRVRLLGATTFKYRGQVQPISDDHVRDTGYLWSNIQNKPELGRIRCWFSAHEQLSAAFVKELPDEALPVPAGWARVDGLCAIDGSWQLEFPKRVATLKYYGEVLRNCVGGYGPAIKSGRSVIFAVREHGLLTHCVEACDNYINQFYRAGNSSPNYNIKQSVESALIQAKLIS